MKKITKYFFNGLLFLGPVAITVYIFYTIFQKIDGLFKIPYPGIGFILTLLLVTLIGFMASNILTRSILDWVDNSLNKLPLAKLIYSSLKDLIGAFVGDKKSFNKPVLVTLFSNSPAKAIGFVTRDDLEFMGMKDSLAVYFPQSYNFAGQLLIFPKENITPLDLSSSEVMTLIISGGVSGR